MILFERCPYFVVNFGIYLARYGEQCGGTCMILYANVRVCLLLTSGIISVGSQVLDSRNILHKAKPTSAPK